MLRLANVTASLTLVLGFAVVGVVGVWLIKPYDVLQSFNAATPRHVLTPVVAQRGLLLYKPGLDCKLMDVSGTISRSFVDGVIYQAPIESTDRKIGCREDDDIISVMVPRLPAGFYTMRVTITYRVNPLRDVIYRYETEPFEVINEVR